MVQQVHGGGQPTHNNKRIAKNTVFLYIRMLFIMGVTLYTSRVILDKLGVDDYGIYGAVGGIVGMLGFLNGTLSTGTSRFLTFELGAGNFDKLKLTFNTAFYTHLALALIVALCLETGGLWFIYNKLIIPDERLFAAQCVLHFSVLTTLVSVTQVPYTSTIIAHENMKIYAYLGILDAFSRLSVVFLLDIANWDKLIFYAALIASVQLMVALFYRYYSMRNYKESKLSLSFDVSIFKKMMGFSGWSLIANVSHVLSSQGYVVIINMFFVPAVVAAQTIGNQISAAIMQFISNLNTAINPQIIKLYAAGQYKESQKLNLQSSVYVFELLLLLGLPCIVVMKPLLNLWLVEVPEYAVIFAQYIVAMQILNCYNGTLYTPMVASGELKHNSYAAVGISFVGFALLYLLLRLGCSVMFVQYIAIAQAVLFSYIIKPLICIKRIRYNLADVAKSYLTTFKVAILPVGVSIILYRTVEISSILTMILVVVLICLSVITSAYIFLDAQTRQKVHYFVKHKFLEKWN